jgi:hypothetical protein
MSVLRSTNSLATCHLVSHIFRPVIAGEQHTGLPSIRHLREQLRQREENTNGLMDSAHASGGHDTPSVVLLSSRPGEGTVSAKGWTIRPGSGSAHPPAATGSESAVWPARYLPLGLRRSRAGPEDRFCGAVRNDLRVPLTLEGPTRTMRGVPARRL